MTNMIHSPDGVRIISTPWGHVHHTLNLTLPVIYCCDLKEGADLTLNPVVIALVIAL